MTLILDDSPARRRGARPANKRDGLAIVEMPPIFMRVHPDIAVKLQEQAQARGLSRTDYTGRLLEAAVVAIEEQEGEPLQNTG